MSYAAAYMFARRPDASEAVKLSGGYRQTRGPSGSYASGTCTSKVKCLGCQSLKGTPWPSLPLAKPGQSAEGVPTKQLGGSLSASPLRDPRVELEAPGVDS